MSQYLENTTLSNKTLPEGGWSVLPVKREPVPDGRVGW